VSAVNSVFIGASNELGEFESGITATWFGLAPAIIVGGTVTLAVALIWMYGFPGLRTMDRFPHRASKIPSFGKRNKIKPKPGSGKRRRR